jgi:hypothetical protein
MNNKYSYNENWIKENKLEKEIIVFFFFFFFLNSMVFLILLVDLNYGVLGGYDISAITNLNI